MKRFLFVMLVAAAGFPLCVYGAELRIGYVNATVIFEQYSLAKEAQQAYEKEMVDLNRQVDAMETELQAVADTLEARKFLFSEERLKEQKGELETKQQAYLKFRQEAELKATKRNEDLTKPIVQAIEDAAKKVAEKDGFDLVLDSAAGIVVYSKPELDVTDRVLQVLEEAKQASQAGQTGQTGGGQQ